MVSSLDGKATAHGKASGIGSQADRLIMGNLRAKADAVMTGAGTIRAEKLTLTVPEKLARAREARGLKPQPLAVVATVTGNVPLLENLLGSSPGNLLVLASSQTPEEHLIALSSYASIEVVPEAPAELGSGLDLSKTLTTIKETYSVETLLVEGGPALNHALISAGLADELFLTLAPRLAGGASEQALTILKGPVLPENLFLEPKLLSLHLGGNEIYLRYSLG